METTLQDQIDALVAEHGIEAVQGAVTNSAPGTGCPKGYYWDGSQCVQDAG